jgi:tubulin polyglutamylase TTLL4
MTVMLIVTKMTDPEDNYESSLSISSSERSVVAPAPTINTDCVQGGRVLSAPFAPSLFPFVPPYITFATFEEKGPEIPAIIHKQLKWKLTTITPLLVRKVLLNTGFRLMKSE